MKIHEAAVAVLRETKNPAVMWGDAHLLHTIAERAQVPWRGRASLTERRVLDALTRDPSILIAKKTLLAADDRVWSGSLGFRRKSKCSSSAPALVRASSTRRWPYASRVRSVRLSTVAVVPHARTLSRAIAPSADPGGRGESRDHHEASVPSALARRASGYLTEATPSPRAPSAVR